MIQSGVPQTRADLDSFRLCSYALQHSIYVIRKASMAYVPPQSERPNTRTSAFSPRQPVDYRTKSELVYLRTRERIVNGVLPPGTHLHLQELAESLGVSTVPVREALRRLESEGLVRNRPHAGATVAALDVEKIEAHFMIRGALEGLAARLAATRVTSVELEHLRMLDNRLRKFAIVEDFADWNNLNIEFYRVLFACSNSSELTAMIDLQRDRSPRFRHFPDVLAQRAKEADEARRELLEALRAGDGELVERIQRETTTRTGHMLCAAMARAASTPSTMEHPHARKGGREGT